MTLDNSSKYPNFKLPIYGITRTINSKPCSRVAKGGWASAVRLTRLSPGSAYSVGNNHSYNDLTVTAISPQKI